MLPQQVIQTLVTDKIQFYTIDTRYNKWWIYSYQQSHFLDNVGRFTINHWGEKIWKQIYAYKNLNLSLLHLQDGDYTAGYDTVRFNFNITQGKLNITHTYTGKHTGKIDYIAQK